jgi:endo-1,3(4)-beta-glucanase
MHYSNMHSISSTQQDKKAHDCNAAPKKSYGSILDDVEDIRSDPQPKSSINANTNKRIALSVVAVVASAAFCSVLYNINNSNNNTNVLRHDTGGNSIRSATTGSSSSPTVMGMMRPSSSSSSSSSSKEKKDNTKAPSFTIPFPQVDRADYGDPVSSFLQEDIFADHLRSNNANENGNKFVFPFPTGAFWTNFALPSTDAERGISYPIAVYPYAYKWSPAGFLQVSYPASHRLEDATSIRDAFYPDVTIATVETNVHQRKIQSFDPLSVTLRFTTATDDYGDGKSLSYFESYLVQGSPYITMKYEGLTPSIKALSQFLDLQVIGNDDTTTATTHNNGMQSVTGTHFLAKTREGLNWMIASSEPITLDFDTRIPTTIMASKPFSGVLRLACLPVNNNGRSKHSSNNKSDLGNFFGFQGSSVRTGLQLLVHHSSAYPIGGTVDWTFRSTTTKESSNRIATLHFDFDTKHFAPNHDDSSSIKELLMLALPHHAQLLSEDVLLKEFDLNYECIKGRMTAVTGSSWKYDEPLLNIGFAEGPGSIKADDTVLNDARVRESLINNLQHDVNIALPVLNENIYGYGKQAARLAQLAFIGSEILRTRTGNETDSDLAAVVDETVQTLYTAMASLLDSATKDKLVYDANLGGIVTSDGLANTMADFGNGRYNDHHFHYGYVLYASAILGRLDPSFVKNYGNKVDALFYDVANNANVQSSEPSKGAFFPGSRHKLWFDGHSYASGLFAFGNGKSQESSSEAVNCYYGAYMWSLVTNGATEEPQKDVSAKTDFARLLLATEIRGTKTYWHMIPPQKLASTQMAVYSPEFAENYMVGNVGMLDVVCTTWFGTNKLYVHMINFIPVTAAAAALFDEEYVRAEYNNVLSPMHEIDEAWRGFVIADHAIIDPNAAWDEAQQIFSPTLDAGLSKTQLLFFTATRANFDPSSIMSTTSSAVRPATASSMCRNHPACVDANLVGECCPTQAGSMLGCCGADSKTVDTTTNGTVPADSKASTESSASCSSHLFCADANLVGDCCPTKDGSYLGCCGSSAKTSGSIKAIAAAVPTNTKPTTVSEKEVSSASCSSNPSCADANLVGDCCPTPEGSFLGCCSTTSSTNTSVTSATVDTAKKASSKQQQQQGTSSCGTNPACAELDLVGECCPTPEGAFLGCCA